MLSFQDWSQETKHDGTVNPVDVYCPNLNCRSKILRKHVGQKQECGLLVEQDLKYKVQLPPMTVSSTATDTPFYWMIKDMMQFENIGFSRPVTESPYTATSMNPVTAGTLRYLACADCEVGPLGFNFVGENIFLLAGDRLRYNMDS